MTGILAERKLVSVGKSVTDGAMLVNTLSGKTVFEDNARSFSQCKRINLWRNILFPVPLAGRMQAVGCRLTVMRKRCDRKLREARMISIFKRQYRKENGKQAYSHKIWIHNSSVKVTKNNSHITLSYSDYELIRMSRKTDSLFTRDKQPNGLPTLALVAQSTCTTNDEINGSLLYEYHVFSRLPGLWVSCFPGTL